MAQQKLELTWYGKENEIKVEPRLLIENPRLSYKSPSRDLFSNTNHDNILIHGDNLIALKSLEKDYSNKIKCIYIDPPYNTGSAFEHYDDNIEHSIWLNLMYHRLKSMKNLLMDNGVIFVQIDANEFAYLSIMMDEIFGRSNRLNIITVKTKVAGVSGSHAGKSLQDTSEYILGYVKDKNFFEFSNVIYDKYELYQYISDMVAEGKSWKYTSVLTHVDEGTYVKSILDGNGDEIQIFSHTKFETESIGAVAKRKYKNDLKSAYYGEINSVFRTTNAQSSIRTRVLEETQDIDSDVISINYVPKSGKNKGKEIKLFYKGMKRNLVTFLSEVVEIEGSKIYKKDKLGTIWTNIQYNNLTKEGYVVFPNGKKPEQLLQTIIQLGSNPGDIILDSFLGSGSTIATAHKLNRKWIGIELGEHAFTHVKVRIDRIINGEDKGGITVDSNWNGGGGYKFYELAPSLIQVDEFDQAIINSEYNADMLASAIALHEGYKYEPNQSVFWKQAKNGDSSYLFTTTKHLDRTYLDAIHSQMNDDEFLVISCKSFESNIQHLYKNISIKKIPQSLLKNCEFGVDNYNLNIINPPVYEEDDEDE